MFVLELRADDVHAALGRLLDQVRLAGIPLAAVEAVAGNEGYTVRATLRTEDHDGVDRLVRRTSTIVGVSDTWAARERAPFGQVRAAGAA